MLVKYQGELPERSHSMDAGYDLRANLKQACILYPGQTKRIPTGLKLFLPYGAALVCSRSGLALAHSVFVINAPGVIDPGYNGEVCVLLHNADNERAYHVQPGEAVAQLLFIGSLDHPVFQEGEPDESTRGEGGFGSTDCVDQQTVLAQQHAKVIKDLQHHVYSWPGDAA